MRIPDTLASLADYGLIDEVLRPLMSGKEAQIYLIRAGGEYRVAKVYKEAQNRTFKNRAEYTEGRKVRNSRDQRAMGKGTRHGRAKTEAAWRTTEVDMIYRLREAGVRVPTPYHFIDGVLVMEMITDPQGEPAPRLGDVRLDLEGAQEVFDRLLAEVVRMLAAGVVHGDLSDFNVLMGPDGPVIIDFPQAVDASSNKNARKLLLRDVDNLHRFMERLAPERKRLPYAQEMWALYERGELTPDTKLAGRYQAAEHKVSMDAVLGLIGDATRDERRRREHLGLNMRGVAEEPAESDQGSAPRPLSRYAQKREAQIAARKLEAANAPPAAPQPARGGRGHATSPDPARARAGSHSQRSAPHDQARTRAGSQGHAQRNAKAHDQAHARPGSQSQAQRDAPAHDQAHTRPGSQGHAQHKAQPHDQAHTRPGQGQAQRNAQPHDQTRARHAGQGHVQRATPARVDHAHPPAHAKPAHVQTVADTGEAAQKRRRRRRKRPRAEGSH